MRPRPPAYAEPPGIAAPRSPTSSAPRCSPQMVGCTIRTERRALRSPARDANHHSLDALDLVGQADHDREVFRARERSLCPQQFRADQFTRHVFLGTQLTDRDVALARCACRIAHVSRYFN